jgi:hypothetical protein
VAAGADVSVAIISTVGSFVATARTGAGVAVASGSGVSVGAIVGAAVSVGALVAVGTAVAVPVGTDVAVGSLVSVGATVAEGACVTVALGTVVGVLVGGWPHAAMSDTNNIAASDFDKRIFSSCEIVGSNIVAPL